MKKKLLFLILITLGLTYLPATGSLSGNDWQDYLLNERFSIVHSDEGYLEPVDQNIFDYSGGWILNDVYGGTEGVIIKKGGSITTPPLKGLIGNASFAFSGGTEWVAPDSEPAAEPMWGPHAVTISGGGTLSTSEFDPGISVTNNCMYGVGPETRLTLTAAYDMRLTGICIYYAGFGNSGEIQYDDYTGFSHEAGDYFSPIDLELTVSNAKIGDGSGQHNILVYTLDGSEPERTSTRYDGTPLHIDKTTTVRTATIFGNGSMAYDKARTYNFPTASAVEAPENTFEITVTKPGNLKAQLLDLDADVINGLTLKGRINSADIRYLTAGEGRVASVSYLDLADVTFDYDGGNYVTVSYAPEGGMGNTSTVNYFLSENNYEEQRPGGPTHTNYNMYRNNLECAFYRGKIKQVIVPKVLTSVGERAFSCVTAANIPDGVREIGNEAFSNCESINLPASITKIGNYAFGDNLIIYKVDLPNLEYIGDGAFSGVKVTEFVFSDKIKHIGESAFSYTKLTEVALSWPTDTIPASVFAGCDVLTKVVINGDVKVVGQKAFISCPNLAEFSLPETIEQVGADAIPDYLLPSPEGGIYYFGKAAYKRAEDLTEVTIKEGTVSLTDGLFSYCPLEKITLPGSLKFIGEEAFYGTQLTSTPEMNGVKRLESWAFGNCSNLGRITIPETVEYIDNAFYGCNALWSVTYNAIDADCPWGVSPRDLERIVIGDKVRRLPSGLYTGNTNVTEVILPASVEVLDPRVFANCKNLEYVRLSDNITTISDEAFSRCSALADLHWPANLKKIGESAFYKCSALKTISLPEGVEFVDDGAFAYCGNVEKLYLASTITELGYDPFVFDNKDKNIVITTTAETPLAIDWNWYYIGTPLIKVPAKSLAAYQGDSNWSNGGKNEIVSIEGVSAPKEDSQTTFGDDVNGDTDLSDTVVGDVYVTVGEEDGYDETDGSIVLNSTMDEEYVDAVGDMAPGESDLAFRFNGLVVQVPAGNGTVVVNCLTIGSKLISVKIGTSEPQYYRMDAKGDISVNYNVEQDTYVYIYAVETPPVAHSRRRQAAPSTVDCVKIYAVGVNPIYLNIEEISEATTSQISEYYNVNGVRVNHPTAPGLYIGRRADGTATKILIK